MTTEALGYQASGNPQREEYYSVVYRYPQKWQDSRFGRLRMRLAYEIPKLFGDWVGMTPTVTGLERARCEMDGLLDKKYGNDDGKFGYFGIVFPGRPLGK